MLERKEGLFWPKGLDAHQKRESLGIIFTKSLMIIMAKYIYKAKAKTRDKNQDENKVKENIRDKNKYKYKYK